MSRPLKIGQNTNGLAYAAQELPFLNIIKTAQDSTGRAWAIGVYTGGSSLTSDIRHGGAFNQSYSPPSTSGTSIISIASPAVISWTSHNLVTGAAINFSTTGALPTGITAGTRYLVGTVIDANSFHITDTSGSVINTSGSQSGTQTAQTDDLYNFYAFYLDSKGYPTSLTSAAGSQPTGFPQGGFNSAALFAGWFFTDNLQAGNYPFQYDGTGVFDFTAHIASNTAQDGGSGVLAANRIVVNLASNGTPFALTLVSTGSGVNYAKNFSAVWSPDSTTSVVGTNEGLLNGGEIFNPLWVEKIAFQHGNPLRMMNWTPANYSRDINWSDRAPVDWISWDEFNASFIGRIPWEVQIAAANRLNMPPWFNIPFGATPDYIHQLALLAKNGNPSAPAGLQAGVTTFPIRVESGNESFNYYAIDGIARTTPVSQAQAIFPGMNTLGTLFYWNNGIKTMWISGFWQSVFGPGQVLSQMGGEVYPDRCRVFLQYLGSPYVTGSDFNTNSSQVVPGSPTVINFNSHGFVTDQPIMIRPQFPSFDLTTNTWSALGTLPSGLSQAVTYFVRNPTTNSFEIATTPGGTSISGTGSAVNLAVIWWGGTWPTVSIASGSSTTVTWNNHGFVAGQILAFMGLLPTGMDNVHNYYVRSTNLMTNSFEISATPGGGALVTSGGTFTGVQPIFFANTMCENLAAGAGNMVVAAYFGPYPTPNSWSADTPPLTKYFQELQFGGVIPTVSMGTFGSADAVNFTITSGQSFPSTPANSSIVFGNMDFSSYQYQTSGTGIISVGNPTTITWNSHGFTPEMVAQSFVTTQADPQSGSVFGGISGIPIQFSSTGTLPTGISPNTNYYVGTAGIMPNTFQLVDAGNNLITTSGTPSGTITITVQGNGPHPMLAADGGNAFPILNNYGNPVTPGKLPTGLHAFSLTSDTIQHNIGSAVSVNVGTSTFTLNNHGLSGGQFISFYSTGGTLPAPLDPDFVYYVPGNFITTNTFQVSTSKGNGPALTLTGAGTGTTHIYPVGWRSFSAGNVLPPNPRAPGVSVPGGNFGATMSQVYSCYLVATTQPGMPSCPMEGYESGAQMLAGGGAENDPTLQYIFDTSFNDSRMVGAQEAFYLIWDTFNPNATICYYADVQAFSSFGDFELFENVYQSINPGPPRYQALKFLLSNPTNFTLMPQAWL